VYGHRGNVPRNPALVTITLRAVYPREPLERKIKETERKMRWPWRRRESNSAVWHVQPASLYTAHWSKDRTDAIWGI